MTVADFTTGEDLKQARPENVREYLELVAEAVKVHGDKYRYEYMAMRLHRWNIKVIHTCCGAETPWVVPKHVLDYRFDCPNCTKPKITKNKPYTTEEWVETAKTAHGGFYTYEKAVYENSTVKVTVTCPIHGDFKILPSYHVNRKGGCGKCRPKGGNRKPMTTEQYLAKARKKHGDKFDYSQTRYEHSEKHITLTCPEHGVVNIKAHEHLRSKHGCQECAKDAAAQGKKLTTADFIKKAKAKHGSKYDYSKSNYVDSTTELEIICPEHGSFFRTPNNHINGGYGCNECAGVLTYDTDSFIERAKEAHKARGSEYDYSKVEYEGARTPVEIICKEHGSFWQNPHEHLKPHGCPDCGKELGGGWSRSDFMAKCEANNNGNGTLYVIQCRKGKEVFYKVGVTSRSVDWRFKSKRNMPYNYKTVFEIEADGGYIYDLEVTLHSLLKDNRHNPLVDFRGKTECFTTIKPIEPLLKELTTTGQMQLIA